MRLDELDIPWGTGIFERTKRISIELSNICNLATQHKRCPLYDQEERHVLSERVVSSVFDTARRYAFEGIVAFHLYNEPGIDPRLVLFMDRLREACPAAKIYLLTNGFYLNQSLAEELVKHGLSFLGISAYTEPDWDRLSQIQLPIPIRVVKQVLDDRRDWYAWEGLSPVMNRPCYAPLYEICISCRGHVCLCPYDSQRRHVFGDLNRESLEVVMQRQEIRQTYAGLSRGERTLDICKGCRTYRGEPHPEETASQSIAPSNSVQ